MLNTFEISYNKHWQLFTYCKKSLVQYSIFTAVDENSFNSVIQNDTCLFVVLAFL